MRPKRPRQINTSAAARNFCLFVQPVGRPLQADRYQKADEEGHEPNEQVAEGAVNEQQEQRIKQGAHDEIPFFIIGQPKNPSFREKHSQ